MSPELPLAPSSPASLPDELAEQTNHEPVPSPISLRERLPVAEPTLVARWRSGLREFAVIVAGVLAALGAQAWWEGRQERQREHDYLRQLIVDTRENERRLDAAIAVDSAAGVIARRLSDALYKKGALPPAESLMTWMAGAFNSSNFEPLSGTFTALQTTGDLRLIRTDTLRAAIVQYAAKLEYEAGMMRFYLSQFASDIDRIGRALPFMLRLFSVDLDTWIHEPAARDFPFENLRENAEVRGIMFSALVSNANRLTHLRNLRWWTHDLLRILEREEGASTGARESSAKSTTPRP